MIQLSMVGFRKLHSAIWTCNSCEHLVSFPDLDALLEHLKTTHNIQGVNIDADGGAWITETTETTETTN